MRQLLVGAAAATLLVSGCRPSSTVTQTVPIANLQQYRTVVVRVAAAGEGQAQIGNLQFAVVNKLQMKCRFDRVYAAGDPAAGQPDLVVDLNIQRAYRGGGGVISNQNQAVMDVLMVLSDGVHDDLIGSAWIRGKSSSVLVSGGNPEMQALGAVSDSVVGVLSSSGCALARVDPPQEPVAEEPTVPASHTTQADADAVARAEALNDEGKALFRAADVTGAAAKFQEAMSLHTDPRYQFNLCFAYETLNRFDEALQTCQSVLEMSPPERLRGKALERMEVIKVKKAAQ